LAKEGRIILDLDDVVNANHISSQTRELWTLHFGNLEHVVLLEPRLLNPNTQERSFLVTFLDRTTVNMTSCSEVEEEIGEKGANTEDWLREMD